MNNLAGFMPATPFVHSSQGVCNVFGPLQSRGLLAFSRTAAVTGVVGAYGKLLAAQGELLAAAHFAPKRRLGAVLGRPFGGVEDVCQLHGWVFVGFSRGRRGVSVPNSY